MTSPRRFEQDVPALLADMYLAGMPDYRDDLVQRVARTRQRSAWTFPERWLPVELVSARVPTTRFPWRQLGVLALLMVLLAAMLAAYVGSQQARLPAPFGVAGNGLMAYSKDGDIYTVDPTTGMARAIVIGPESDLDVAFSQDGTKVLFARQVTAQPATYDLALAMADGSGLRVIDMDPNLTVEDPVQLTPDGQAVVVQRADGVIVRYDLVDGSSRPIGQGRLLIGGLRPPDGSQIAYEPDGTPEIDLWLMSPDGVDGRLLYRPPLQGRYDFAVTAWSPDGALIAFTCATEADPEGSHICVMDADGTNVRVVSESGPDWFETDLAWSPDGSRIAFNRWERPTGSSDFEIRPIGIASLDGGPVIGVGSAPGDDGAVFDWSPDGTVIVSLPATLFRSPLGAAPAKPIAIDVATRLERELSFDVTSSVSWQRVAP
jgi:Tol biopolymer transport system component